VARTRDQADIERDIEVTREQLARSIGELSGRLDPRRGLRTAALIGGAVVAVTAAVLVLRRW
jgi:hypothetical protein